MEEKEFRKLLNRAQSENVSDKEKELLDKFINSKIKKELRHGENLSNKDLEDSRQKVMFNTLAVIKHFNRAQTFRMVFKYAAVFLILLLASYYLFKISDIKQQTDTVIAFKEVYTKSGERRTIILPDSSIIILNANSYCKYPMIFPEEQRKIILHGEAFFKVTRNEKKPFLVETSKITTTVLGTSFNILENNDSVTVTVSTGKVQVDNDISKKRQILIRNEQCSYNYSTGITTLSHVNSELVSNWSKGILQFKNITFSDAIIKIETWYGVQIECSSANLLKHTLNGVYDNKSLDDVLKDLEFLLDLNYTVSGDTIVLKEK